MLSAERQNLIELMLVVTAITDFAGKNVGSNGREVMLQTSLINGIMC